MGDGFYHKNKEEDVNNLLQGASSPEVRETLNTLSQNSSYLIIL